jgi:hypothetical protein
LLEATTYQRGYKKDTNQLNTIEHGPGNASFVSFVPPNSQDTENKTGNI